MSTPVMQGTGNKAFDIAWVRQQFPSLKLQVNGQPAAFLDGPSGTQVPKQVMDAVHFAPHGLIDVRALDCDFLACSPYKFFGPHMGTLYGKREHLERFKPYKVRPATNTPPESWETGTPVQELIAGIGAAVDYIAELGRHSDAGVKSRRAALQ